MVPLLALAAGTGPPAQAAARRPMAPLDQQAALRWVQRNATAFGGNKHDVTIFSQSAGGLSVCDNLASPTAAGLFVHAIAESGCLIPMPSRQQTEQRDEAWAASLGCKDAATARPSRPSPTR
jgi:para-nitrobenzyl esterase